MSLIPLYKKLCILELRSAHFPHSIEEFKALRMPSSKLAIAAFLEDNLSSVRERVMHDRKWSPVDIQDLVVLYDQVRPIGRSGSNEKTDDHI